MKVALKITGSMLDLVRRDLVRPHFFAHERVGFLTAGAAAVPGGLLQLGRSDDLTDWDFHGGAKQIQR